MRWVHSNEVKFLHVARLEYLGGSFKSQVVVLEKFSDSYQYQML